MILLFSYTSPFEHYFLLHKMLKDTFNCINIAKIKIKKNSRN